MSRAVRDIGDYALIGDCETAALVHRSGAIEWLCWPRFDSEACLAALLGEPEHGRWLMQPAGEVVSTSRRYRGDTLILETRFETAGGLLLVTDFMPLRHKASDLVRIVACERGEVEVCSDLKLAFDYGRIAPLIQAHEDGFVALAGPHAVRLETTPPLRGADGQPWRMAFSLRAGQQATFVLTYFPSHTPRPDSVDAEASLEATERYWAEWAGRAEVEGPWSEAVRRSLITLKALTYRPTGGLIAAPTTSLPERWAGGRNWDYRYCWLRDATFTLLTLLDAGYREEAQAWRDWLLRALAGDPKKVQPAYGVAGEHRLMEWTADWLPGFEGARPVRIGNAAFKQRQLDVFGEVLDAIHQARGAGVDGIDTSWPFEVQLIEHLESCWDEPDEGIWEVRSGPKRFTHSQVMAWVAFDRAVKSVERFGLEGPADRWRALRDEIHGTVCRQGFDETLGAFTRSFGSGSLDASTLLIPLVGFLPPDDPRVVGTARAIQERLTRDGFVLRYDTEADDDGLPPGEGAFLACSFWLADNLILMGRRDEGQALFERLLSIRNDVGLLAEEYDPKARRLLGNFPQAFSHLALVDTAYNLARAGGPAAERSRGDGNG
ncbi:glycoside hydrolase family 15 protein [Phenylobacterium terrae]|uniref:Glycoside hydrolase family 15 protein n=1 Tax=Phenylobacterium terrae TaxID=2665495 RepID=A0ABW4MX66_9CAUL